MRGNGGASKAPVRHRWPTHPGPGPVTPESTSLPDLLTTPDDDAPVTAALAPTQGRGLGRSGPKAASTGLAVAALGVVFGDIGTSPLYAVQTVFAIDHSAVQANRTDVLGVISMMIWSLTLVVSLKYVSIVLRADNNGEGGVLALAARVRRNVGTGRRTSLVIGLGLLGAALFYGDSLITPAISVLSAVEGVNVAVPSLSHLVLPIAVTILVALFAVQRWGTTQIGKVFGPVMLVWFAALTFTGGRQLLLHPDVLRAISPTYAVLFVTAHPGTAFIAMGAIVLCITGAEALYADMGHFGRGPIVLAWFAVGLPALAINYLGQGALLLNNPAAISNPFFFLVPKTLQLPMVVLATAATVIASQAVISGAFSVSRQAVQLGFLPTLTVRQTSENEGGQVYLPAVNIALLLGVVTLTVGFGASARLATAYGVAVTGTLLITTILLCVLVRVSWHWAVWKVALLATTIGGLEVVFFAANLTKVVHGGWLPLLIAFCVFTTMTTWQRGREVVTANRIAKEGPLAEFITDLRSRPVPRVPGTAVFPHPGSSTTPLALRSNLEHNGVLHEKVVILTAQATNVPHVTDDGRLTIDDLGFRDDGIFHVTARYGFSDRPDLLAALQQASDSGLLEVEIDVAGASWFVSRVALRRTTTTLGKIRGTLFVVLARNAADPAAYFNMPLERTIFLGGHVDV